MKDKYTIAVVDDDERILETLKILLESSSEYSVMVISESDKAFDLISKRKPDAVILDIDMPKVSGLDLLKEIKTNKRTQGIPVLMLTGNDTEDYLSSSMYWYADAFLTKPFKRTILMESIAKVLKREDFEPKPMKKDGKSGDADKAENVKEDLGDSALARASIVTQGSRLQFGIAVALISIIPLLTVFYVFQMRIAGVELSAAALWVVAALLMSTVCTGYAILAKYPVTIIKLRTQMEMIARGEIPDSIDLLDDESDITAIHKYFSLIVDGMKARIVTIQEQGEQIVIAERQRVMTESLCTTCHCLGQPATTLSCYLDLLRSEKLTENGQKYLACCHEESGKLKDILMELQTLTEYETEPYCEFESEPESKSVRILQTKRTKTERRPKIVETLHMVMNPEGGVQSSLARASA